MRHVASQRLASDNRCAAPGLPETVWFESLRQNDLLQLDVVVLFSPGGRHVACKQGNQKVGRRDALKTARDVTEPVRPARPDQPDRNWLFMNLLQ